jgi:hypothetical protein
MKYVAAPGRFREPGAWIQRRLWGSVTRPIVGQLSGTVVGRSAEMWRVAKIVEAHGRRQLPELVLI